MSTEEPLRNAHNTNMSDDFASIRFKPIWKYKYAQYFQETQYNGKTLSTDERKQFVAVIDETIAQFSEGFPLLQEMKTVAGQFPDKYQEIGLTFASVSFFVLITMIDCMVVSKFFILANQDYEKQFMRGKLRVILNEGFKKLYGFEEKTHKSSAWDRLLPILRHFPEKINYQYQDLTFHLEKHARSSTWWREERNLETHLDAEKLYDSRQEEIIESKVMMDSMKLYNTLLAVNLFLSNMHTCIYNTALKHYRNREPKDK